MAEEVWNIGEGLEPFSPPPVPPPMIRAIAAPVHSWLWNLDTTELER